MKNFVFISPNFPTNYWQFCRELKNNGLRVLGIGDQPYDTLLPELKSSNFNIRSFGERVALNTPIQGTAADIIKLAMLRVDAALKKQKLKARLVLQVHDELIVECPVKEAEQVKKIVTAEMENVAQLRVPLLAEAKVGASWYEAK